MPLPELINPVMVSMTSNLPKALGKGHAEATSVLFWNSCRAERSHPARFGR